MTAELSGINLFDINIFPSDIVSVLDDFITVNISTIDLGFLENTVSGRAGAGRQMCSHAKAKQLGCHSRSHALIRLVLRGIGH